MNHSVSTMSGKTKVKIVFLGNQSVGKSSIIEKYIHDRFDDTANVPTVGIDFLAKNVSHQAKNYRLQLWDTAGQERFRSLIPNYLKDANYALLTYDVTNYKSLQCVKEWLHLYNENKTIDGTSVLIGNKIDLPREVSYEEGLKKAQELGLKYFQISAKTGQSIPQVFTSILESYSEKHGGSSNYIPPRDSMYKKKESENTKSAVIKEQKEDDYQQSKKQSQRPDQSADKLADKQKYTQNIQKKSEAIVLAKEDLRKNNGNNKKKGCC